MMLTPVRPFEPVSADRCPVGASWIAQIKWDGVRMLTYCDDRDVRLVNRRLHDRTLQYPELQEPGRYCSASSFILDGELIALDRRKPSFREIMRRDSLRQAKRIERATAETPVTYMVFDVLYCEGEWVTDRPLAERQKLLERIVRPQPYVQLVPNVSDAEGLLRVMEAHGMEGIVCKDLSSRYAIGGKDKRWQKRKLYRDLYAVVGGATHRDGVVNALLLGLYDADGRLIYIGHAGAGKVSQAEWAALTARARSLAVGERPFAEPPERSKGATWMRPEIVVKVRYAEWTAGGTLRQPVIQSFAELPPGECTTDQ